MATRKLSARGAKNKGSNFERELAAYINTSTGLTSRRALLSGGGWNTGGADIEGTPHIHVEAKRTETFAPYEAMRQAEKSITASENEVWPVVVNRKNGMATGSSLVVMRLDDWLRLYNGVLPSDKPTEEDKAKGSFMSLLS
jgi:hypothetical protein